MATLVYGSPLQSQLVQLRHFYLVILIRIYNIIATIVYIVN